MGQAGLSGREVVRGLCYPGTARGCSGKLKQSASRLMIASYHHRCTGNLARSAPNARQVIETGDRRRIVNCILLDS